MNNGIELADARFLRLFEAVKRTLGGIEILYTRMQSDIASLEPLIDKNENLGVRALPIHVTAMGLVDFLHRFGQLLDAMPTVNQGHEALQELKMVLSQVKDARHYLQHMRREVMDLSNRRPILGAVCWARGNCSTSLVMSETNEVSHSSIPLDTVNRRWATSHGYVVGDHLVDLAAGVRSARAAYDFLSERIPDKSLADPQQINAVACRFGVSPSLFEFQN